MKKTIIAILSVILGVIFPLIVTYSWFYNELSQTLITFKVLFMMWVFGLFLISLVVFGILLLGAIILTITSYIKWRENDKYKAFVHLLKKIKL